VKNRSGVEYEFRKLSDKLYEFVMDKNELKYCRFGGHDGEDFVNDSNLGMFDPSGGPYIAVGMEFKPGETVSKIELIDGKILIHAREATGDKKS